MTAVLARGTGPLGDEASPTDRDGVAGGPDPVWVHRSPSGAAPATVEVRAASDVPPPPAPVHHLKPSPELHR